MFTLYLLKELVYLVGHPAFPQDLVVAPSLLGVVEVLARACLDAGALGVEVAEELAPLLPLLGEILSVDSGGARVGGLPRHLRGEAPVGTAASREGSPAPATWPTPGVSWEGRVIVNTVCSHCYSTFVSKI